MGEQLYMAKDTWKSNNGKWYFSTQTITSEEYETIPTEEQIKFCKHTEPNNVFHHYEAKQK